MSENRKDVLSLDVGCGTNCFGEIGVDLYFPYLPLVARAGKEAINADCHHLPFRDKVFHKVYSFGLISVATHPDNVIAEMSRVLSPGGTLIVSVTRHIELLRILLSMRRVGPVNSIKAVFKFLIGRYKAYTARGISKKIEASGLRVKRCMPVWLQHRGQEERLSHLLCIGEKTYEK